MLTILEAINLSTEYLSKKEIDSPRINAELLLAHTLNCKRLDLYLSFDRPLDDNEVNLYRDFIKRRGKAEPLQYIIGQVEFYGLVFKVNPSVLIPRPETEILIEAIINSVSKDGKIKILDIGAGSGNISICLAKHLPHAFITSTDINQQALETAKENALQNGVPDRINFSLHNIESDESIYNNDFDIVVSNPPYISIGEFPSLKPELKVYEPKIALTDFDDGLKFFRIISLKASDYLKLKGKLFFELGAGQSEYVKNIMVENGFNEIAVKKDYQQIDRVISGVKI
jgi:release factor glutamine methyltransferase